MTQVFVTEGVNPIHNAKVTLKKVRKVYPLLKITDVAGGFYVHPSPPAIPRRPPRRKLEVTNG